MTDTKSLATIAPVSTLPSQGEWNTITSMAQELITTGFLPLSITKPAQAAAIMLKGRELGVPPMYSLSNINVIKGKPVANAELMMALVKRAYSPASIWFEESSNEIATVGYKLPGQAKERFYSFTINDATQAQLGGDNWKKYPAAMLRARCVSAVCRMAFPEVIAGLYSPGELGDEVEVDEDGVIVSASISENAPAAPQDRPQRAERQNTTPDTSRRPTPIQANVEGVGSDTLDTIPEDLKEALATGMWKQPSWEAMSGLHKNQVRLFLRGKGPGNKQPAFDQFVAEWEAAQHEDDDDVIEGEVVQQGGFDELMPSEADIPTPASFRN